MNALKVHIKLVVIASVFSALVTCQSVMLNQMAGAAPEPEPQPTKTCHKAEQPPWLEEEPAAPPCPVYGSKSS